MHLLLNGSGMPARYLMQKRLFCIFITLSLKRGYSFTIMSFPFSFCFTLFFSFFHSRILANNDKKKFLYATIVQIDADKWEKKQKKRMNSRDASASTTHCTSHINSDCNWSVRQSEEQKNIQKNEMKKNLPRPFVSIVLILYVSGSCNLIKKGNRKIKTRQKFACNRTYVYRQPMCLLFRKPKKTQRIGSRQINFRWKHSSKLMFTELFPYTHLRSKGKK